MIYEMRLNIKRAALAMRADFGRMDSVFDSVEYAEPIEVQELRNGFNADKYEDKVDLGVGVYRNEEGKPWLMPVIRRVEQYMANDPELNHEYLPFLGMDSFIKSATALILGSNSPALVNGKAFGIHTLSGTGACKIGSEFLRKVLKFETVYIPAETWENHVRVFTYSGFPNIKFYRYWDPKNHTLDFDGLIEDLSNAPDKSVVVLHPCAHNPTGCDPTHEQWTKIADIVIEKNHFPFFDCAYQGLVTGDPESDVWSVRHFVERGLELFCAQSFAKMFGLYNERVGNLVVVVNNTDKIDQILSQFRLIARFIYCSPPNHGARIVDTILRNRKLYEEWQSCVQKMATRIQDMRNGLKERLQKLGTPGSWDHIIQQVGMFSYLGLTESEVQHLRRQYHIYMLSNGRANMCGLNIKNIDYVARAIHETVLGRSEV